MYERPMEWLTKQFELWPRKITPEELNDELEKDAKRDRRKGEDLVSKEETTKVLEGEGAKEIKILSPKKSAEKVREVIKMLEEKERK